MAEERAWKLGEDLVESDYLLDPVTFEELITTVRCNCKVITPEAVRSEMIHIMKLRNTDLAVLLENSMDAIIKAAKEGRG